MVTDRAEATEAIAAGRVLVGGSLADKPTRLVAGGEPVELTGPPPRFVGRAGEKLDAALDRFEIDPSGARCVDAGSSTGGFTDCLLQRGARHVVAIDVGTHQLHERLRADERVEVRERTNVRDVAAGDIGGPVDLVVADLSFTSVVPHAPNLVALARQGGDLVVLVKPQFEASRAEADRARGVIRDPAVWRSALEGAAGALRVSGAAIMGAMVSPVRGSRGNVELLLHARVPGPGEAVGPIPAGLLDAAVAAAVAEGPD